MIPQVDYLIFHIKLNEGEAGEGDSFIKKVKAMCTEGGSPPPEEPEATVPSMLQKFTEKGDTLKLLAKNTVYQRQSKNLFKKLP